MTTAELPPRYTLVRPPLLTPENAAAANAASASAAPAMTIPQPSPSSSSSSLHLYASQHDMGSSYYLSPRTISALADFERRTRDPNVLYGRDVVQVPLRLETTNEYVNLVLSHREFDKMAVHIPQYDEMQPLALVDAITRILKDEDQTTQRRQLKSSGLGGTDASNDATAAFQARVLELEFEMKRLNTKLAAARSLQSSVTDENTALRVAVRELEAAAVEIEKLRMQNDVLREQAVAAATDNARMRKVAADAQRDVLDCRSELEMLRLLVQTERKALQAHAADVLSTMTQRVLAREAILQTSYDAEKTERQAIAEKFYELSGRIRVFCRMRPPTQRDGAVALIQPKPHSVLVEASNKEFAFDHVFGWDSTQRDVYAQVEPVVLSFADGFNACIMAYGQTGTGKTYTMMGMRHAGEAQGVIPRALQQVFAVVDARQLTYKDELRVSMVEIYNDQLLDLLHDDASRTNKGAAVKNESDLTARPVTLWSHVDDVLTEGNANRNIAATSMNSESSRSHALVFLHLTSQHRATHETRRSTLCLVDLAGSERIARSQVEGERLKETQHINKSLAALGDVVYALQHKAKHIPYRNSKLTYVLRDMLSGHAKTLLMLQLSPDVADVDETTCSLQFGARVSQVTMGAVRPSVESGELLRLKDDAKAFERQLKASDAKVVEWKDECRYKTEQLNDAREQLKALELELLRARRDSLGGISRSSRVGIASRSTTMHENNDCNDDSVDGRQDNDDDDDVGDRDGASSGSESLLFESPPSPTPSTKSTRSTTSTASLPAMSTSTTTRLMATRKPLSASVRHVAASSVPRDPALDPETRRKSLSTLPTRTASTLSARSIRSAREAPTALPSRRPLASSSTASTSSSLASPAASRVARPRSSLGGSTSTAATAPSGAPRTPLRRNTGSLASSAGPSTTRTTSTSTSTTTPVRRPLSTRTSSLSSSSSSSARPSSASANMTSSK